MAGIPAPAAETITGFSAARAEALCKGLLPSQAAVRAAGARQNWAEAPARPHRQPAGPALNWNDAPEATIANTRRGRSGDRFRSQAFRGDRRLPGTVLQPLLEELATECAAGPVSEGVSDAEESSWACRSCTFENAAAMPVCEMCGHPAASAPQRRPPQPPFEQALAEPLADTGSRSWPALAAAADASWDLAEVSSVASSWLDVADLGELAGAEAADDAGFVLVQEPAAAPARAREPAGTSWASRATAGPGPGAAAASGPRPAARVPPLCRQQPRRGARRAAAALCGEEGLEDELDGLADRRLCPNTLRGVAQRRRRGREC